jgi:hypothetical protein
MSVFFNLTRRYIIPATTEAGGEPGFVFDTEFDGFAYNATKVHCIVIVDLANGQTYKYGPDQIEAGLAHLARAKRLSGHNILNHDLPLLRRLYDWSPPPDCDLVDTLVCSRLILADIASLDDEAAARGDPKLGDLRGSHSLEAWGIRLGFPKVGADITDYSVCTPKLVERCVGDTAANVAVLRFLQPGGYSQSALKLEHRVAPICDQISRDGAPFNAIDAEQLRKQWEARHTELKEQLREQLPELKNPSSRTQIGQLLEANGWVPEERTKKAGRPRITDEVLETIPAIFAKFAGLAELDLLRRRLTALADGDKAWLKHVGADGRIHGSIVPLGTPHHRAKHLNPNLAQVPNAKKGSPYAAECRALFQAPAGWVFVCCDQANLQDRALAHYLTPFDDGRYARAFLSGEDQHWKGAIALELVPKATERNKESQASHSNTGRLEEIPIRISVRIRQPKSRTPHLHHRPNCCPDRCHIKLAAEILWRHAIPW